MLNFNFFKKGLRIVSPPHFVYNFSRKMFLKSYFIKSQNKNLNILRTKRAFSVK